jgi:hypothetical protein
VLRILQSPPRNSLVSVVVMFNELQQQPRRMFNATSPRTHTHTCVCARTHAHMNTHTTWTAWFKPIVSTACLHHQGLTRTARALPRRWRQSRRLLA